MNDALDRMEALKAERDRFVSLAFCGADVLFVLNRELSVLFVAGPTEAFFGKKRAGVMNVSFRDLILPADAPLIAQMLKQLLKVGRINDEIIRVVGPAGTGIRMILSAYCLDSEHGDIYVGVRRLTSSGKTLALNVMRDEESGLIEASSFAEVAANRVKRVQSTGEDALITMLSIPALNELKDKVDPKSGEKLIRSVGDFLKANSLGGDSVAKVTDDGFSILHTSGADISEMTAQVEAMIKRSDPEGREAKVEAATMVMDVDDDCTEDDLAKGLLYVIARYRDSSEHIDLKSMTDNMSTMISKARTEVTAFKRMVSQSQFFVALQPIIQVHTGEIHHFEALCRFESKPDASPFEAITFAEETGLIHEFDLAMARKVVEWLSKVPRNNDKYRVAVNISGFSISKESYVTPLLEMLEENEWTQGKLMFEITESSRMSDLEHANKFFQSLRERGYHVCLDDFGAGAASFQYLSVLDVDVVKIDGSAVKNAQRAPKGRAFLSALTELCRRMNVETIAEMVDTPPTLDFVRDCGCNYVQGFLFGRPSREVRDFTPLPQIDLFRRGGRRAGP